MKKQIGALLLSMCFVLSACSGEETKASKKKKDKTKKTESEEMTETQELFDLSPAPKLESETEPAATPETPSGDGETRELEIFTQPPTERDWSEDYKSLILVPEANPSFERVQNPEYISGLTLAYIGDPAESGLPYVMLSTSDGQFGEEQIFVLDGIQLPISSPTSVPDTIWSYSLMTYLYEQLNHMYVYLETDGTLNADGYLHGILYFKPDADSKLKGQTIFVDELIQLNELLLIYGFAEPDRSYTGPYSKFYQQYPDLKDNFAGYPVMNPDRAHVLNEVALYEPDNDGTYYPDRPELHGGS